MPGVVRGEGSSCDVPLLPFFYQVEGALTDLFYLKFELYSVGSGTKLYEKVVDLREHALGGDKLATGYYVAVFDPYTPGALPEDPPILDMSTGAYDIVWRYRTVDGAPLQTASYYFEVLDSSYFRTGTGYAGYVSSADDRFTSWTVLQRQQAILRSSREVDRLTGRHFFREYRELLLSPRKQGPTLFFDDPIIGIGALSIRGSSPVLGVYTETEVSVEDLRIYNRHLAGMLSPDDREDPRLEYVWLSAEDTDMVDLVMFPAGAKNLKLTGVFGYTDPDGSPFGETPKPLRDAVRMLAYKQLKDPYNEDVVLQQPGRVEMAKTRDQQIKFATTGGSSSSSSGSGTGSYQMTGDPIVDAILASYCRPWHVGVVGG